MRSWLFQVAKVWRWLCDCIVQWLTRSPDTREIPSSSLGIVIFFNIFLSNIFLFSVNQSINQLDCASKQRILVFSHRITHCLLEFQLWCNRQNANTLVIISRHKPYQKNESNKSKRNKEAYHDTRLFLVSWQAKALFVQICLIAAAVRVRRGYQIRILHRSKVNSDVRIMNGSVMNRIPVVIIRASQTIGFEFIISVGRQLPRTIGIRSIQRTSYLSSSKTHAPSCCFRRKQIRLAYKITLQMELSGSQVPDLASHILWQYFLAFKRPKSNYSVWPQRNSSGV